MARPLTFREIITILLRQGSTVRCFRCGEPILYAEDAEREHFLERALGGDDSIENARISHAGCHAQITRGTGATTAGTSVGKAAKDKRIGKGKMIVEKRAAGEPRRPSAWHSRPFQKGHRAIPSRPFPSGPHPMSKRRG
jgi:hypothetical protein